MPNKLLNIKHISELRIAVNSAITACEKAGGWEWALELLLQMAFWQLTPDVVSFSAASSACEKGAQWTWSLQLLQEMQEKKVEPDNYSYAAAISDPWTVRQRS